MMRVLSLFLLLSLAPEALAQGMPSVQDRSGTRVAVEAGETAMMFAGGLSAALAAGTATATLVGNGTPLELSVPLVYAVGATGFALGVHGTAQLLRVDGTLRNALGDALTGALIGGAVGGGVLLLLQAAEGPGAACDFICLNGNKVDTVAAGATIAFLVPVVWVLADYRDVAPTVIYGPEGQAVPGLSLSIGL